MFHCFLYTHQHADLPAVVSQDNPKAQSCEAPVKVKPLCLLQQSLLTVLKESFKVYKAISEGLINLADRFFEMEYLDAHKGLEVYKESIVANDRLQQYYQQIEQIEELRRAIQFPKLESPPADFLTQMEAYAKEAPRPYDESSGAVTGSKKVLPLCDVLPSRSAATLIYTCYATLLVISYMLSPLFGTHLVCLLSGMPANKSVQVTAWFV